MIESNPARDSSWVDRGDDRLSELLADPHCRYLIEYLEAGDDPATLADAATHVVARITDSEPDDVPPDVVRRVKTWLHHGQLPELDEHGIVDFDPDAGTVSLASDEPHRVAQRL